MTIAAILGLFFTLAMLRWLVRRLMRGVVSSIAGLNPRIKIAKLHMMDTDQQFKVFHTQGLALTRSQAFEDAYAKTEAAPEEEPSAAVDAAVARALAARNAPTSPPPPPGAARAFGRRGG